MGQIKLKCGLIENELNILNRQKKDMHSKLMVEQERASKRKAYGEKKYDDNKIALRAAQGKGENTTSKNKGNINNVKNKLLEQLDHYVPEIILPKFALNNADIGDCTILSINDASVSYEKSSKPILQKINLSLRSRDRVAIQGSNASGKTTLIKAIMDRPSVIKFGSWYVPNDIGYLDQHYETLSSEKTVLQTIAELVPRWSHIEVRRHLNEFLFRKNEQVNVFLKTLSGGEKATLSVWQIAAKTVKLLILDEITNNLDLETKDYIIQILTHYPSAMIIVSHDADFLKEISIDKIIDIENYK